MSDDSEDDDSIVFASWDEFIAGTEKRYKGIIKHDREKLKYVSTSSSLPSKKSICYGLCPAADSERLVFVRCKHCDHVVRDVGIAHHLKLRHNFRPQCRESDSYGDSGDDYQGFLLSPTHNPNVPSTSADGMIASAHRPNTKIADSSLQTKENPPYFIEQKNELVLTLSKRTNATNSLGSADRPKTCNGLEELATKPTRDKSRPGMQEVTADRTAAFFPEPFTPLNLDDEGFSSPSDVKVAGTSLSPDSSPLPLVNGTNHCIAKSPAPLEEEPSDVNNDLGFFLVPKIVKGIRLRKREAVQTLECEDPGVSLKKTKLNDTDELLMERGIPLAETNADSKQSSEESSLSPQEASPLSSPRHESEHERRSMSPMFSINRSSDEALTETPVPASTSEEVQMDDAGDSQGNIRRSAEIGKGVEEINDFFVDLLREEEPWTNRPGGFPSEESKEIRSRLSKFFQNATMEKLEPKLSRFFGTSEDVISRSLPMCWRESPRDDEKLSTRSSSTKKRKSKIAELTRKIFKPSIGLTATFTPAPPPRIPGERNVPMSTPEIQKLMTTSLNARCNEEGRVIIEPSVATSPESLDSECDEEKTYQKWIKGSIFGGQDLRRIRAARAAADLQFAVHQPRQVPSPRLDRSVSYSSSERTIRTVASTTHLKNAHMKVETEQMKAEVSMSRAAHRRTNRRADFFQTSGQELTEDSFSAFNFAEASSSYVATGNQTPEYARRQLQQMQQMQRLSFPQSQAPSNGHFNAQRVVTPHSSPLRHSVRVESSRTSEHIDERPILLPQVALHQNNSSIGVGRVIRPAVLQRSVLRPLFRPPQNIHDDMPVLVPQQPMHPRAFPRASVTPIAHSDSERFFANLSNAVRTILHCTDAQPARARGPPPNATANGRGYIRMPRPR